MARLGTAPYIGREDVVDVEDWSMGGKPSRGTPADKRLTENKAKATKGTPVKSPMRGPVSPMRGGKPGGGKR